jgi:hypothetical protein
LNKTTSLGSVIVSKPAFAPAPFAGASVLRSVADQASPHIAKSVKAFVVGQKRLELFYLPA